MPTREAVCAAVAGGTCAAGFSLSDIAMTMQILATAVSIVAGVLAIYSHYGKKKK